MINAITENKKAQLGHGLTWLWKFFILILVIGGVIAVVVSHYSSQFDVRNAEASILSRKLVECLAPQGIISDINTLNVETIKSCMPLDETEIYINLSMERENKNNNLEFGQSFLATLCQTKEKKVSIKFYPSCLDSQYHVLIKDKQNKMDSSMLNLFIAIRKVEKNL